MIFFFGDYFFNATGLAAAVFLSRHIRANVNSWVRIRGKFTPPEIDEMDDAINAKFMLFEKKNHKT